MNTATLYRDLTVQGVTLYLDGGALRYRAPKGKMTPDVLANIKAHKLELVSLLATNDHHENNINNIESIVRESNRESDNISTWSMDRYTHLITCQQCEHLTLTGYCRVKPQYKPQPEAMRDCSSFEAVSGERVAITNAPYSASELNDLLSRYEKKLFNHLLECKQCDFEAARYCAEVFTTGSSYDALLLVFDDAASKREALLTQVIRARISGRSVFVSLDHDNLPTPQQKPVKPLTYGIGDSERPFVNHVMACKQCRPRSALYCADGLKLKANA